MVQFEDMQVFVRVVEAGSITKAADQLQVVKSAVSKRLADLEKRLGVALINRTTRRQSLTDSGRSYYQHCLRILDDIADVETSLRDSQSALSGKIKLAAPLSFGLTHLSGAIRQFNQLHPDIYFDVDFNDRKLDLIEEGFDLAFRIARLDDSSFVARKICQMNIHLCASPWYLDNYGRPEIPEDLVRGHVKLQYSAAPESWPFVKPDGSTVSINLPSVLRSNNGQFLSEAAIDGMGLIMTPDFISYDALKEGKLIPVLTDYLGDTSVHAYAIYPKARYLTQRVRVFIEYLSEYFYTPCWKVD